MESSDNIIEKLKSYGADIDGTMNRMLNDKEFYIDCLRMFLEDENFEKLKVSLDAGDLSATFDVAHTLKGVSANLGLTPIYCAVCNIVEPLRERKNMDYQELYDCLMTSKKQLELLLL